MVPRRKVADPSQLTPQEAIDGFDFMNQIMRALKTKLKAQGFNVGMNLGAIAGAGIPQHLHWHIVPRWKGDVNFMPVIADTKVISESLGSVYDQLFAYFHPKNKKRPKRR